MKNFFKSLAICALAALTFASCQKENAGGNMDDQSSVVSINLTSPLMGTKAFADGNTVNVVHVHVYKVGANGALTYIEPGQSTAVTPSQNVPMTNGSATYSTRLVTGQTYTFVFWADYIDNNGNSHYTYDTDTKTITVNYTNAVGNDETRDAFYAVLPNVQITGAYSNSVPLKRPFAQVNFGVTTEDYNAANRAGVTVNGAAVKCTNVANKLNLLSGAVSGSVDVVAFASANIPTATLRAADKDYKYVAMNYVLVGKDASTLSDITLTLDATGAASATPEYTYHNIPLQGNFRTNIVGDLFTSPASINITVDSRFDGNNNEVIQSVASVTAANEAFANGATNVSISVAEDGDPETIVLPNTIKSVTLTIENYPATRDLTIDYSSVAGAAKPASLIVTAPNAQNITINCPETHVEVNGVTANSITASTSNNTLVIGRDVTVKTLTLEAGNCIVYGKVNTLKRGESNPNAYIEYHIYDKLALKKAVGSQQANKVILENDITFADYTPSGFDSDYMSKTLTAPEITVDLNGHSIKRNGGSILKLSKGTISFVGRGVIENYMPFMISGSTTSTDENYSVLTIGPDITVKGSVCLFVNQPKSTYNNYGIVVNCNNKFELTTDGMAATVNGTNTVTEGNVPIFNFDGASITGGAIGIYAAGYAKWNLKNTNITGKESAIEVRAGEVTIDGGEYKATNTPFSITPEGSGTTINGAALGISQHTTDLPINVVVNSGTFTGEHAIHEEDVQNETGRESIKLKVNGGTFNGAIYSQNNQNCLVGGTYDDASVFNYTAEGYECLMNANNTYTVVTAQEAGFYKNGDYTVISNLNGLKLFAMKVNSLGKTFKDEKLYLAASIDLDGAEWAPIGPNADGPNKFQGEFEGGESTISNFVINQDAAYHAAGFFGALNGTVQNLRFKNVTVKSISAGNSNGYTDNGTAIVAGSIYPSGLIHNVSITNCSVEGNRYVGGIAGYVYGSITDCKADNVIVTAKCDDLTGEWDNGDKAGVIVGYFAADNTSTSIENNTVTASSVTAYRDFGGIAGCAEGSANALVKNNRVDGITLTVDKTHNYKNFTQQSSHNVNGAIGRGGDGNNTTNNVNIVY